MFSKGDLVKDLLKDGEHVGKVTGGDQYGGVYVFDARTGQSGFYTHPKPATKEEYDAQIEQRLHPQKDVAITQPAKRALSTPTQKAKTYRWSCLECGAKYNGRECPRCGGEDRILNTENDHDLSYVGGSHSEPYAPGE